MAQPGTNPFNIAVNVYDQTQQGFIAVIPKCNAVIVTNLGDTIATINGAILFPSATPATDAGDSLAFGGNEGDVYSGNLKLAFAFPVGANPQVQIIQQFYI
jgi:hypothetical protein